MAGPGRPGPVRPQDPHSDRARPARNIVNTHSLGISVLDSTKFFLDPKTDQKHLKKDLPGYEVF